MTKNTLGTDVIAAIVSGLVGLSLIIAIWATLVFPAPVAVGGGGILTGDQIPLREHEWGFNQFTRGGPEICAVTGNNVTITLQNDGRNLHGFQIVRDGGVFVAGLNSTDLLHPGDIRQVTIKVDLAGNYYYICPVAGHRTKGMVAPVVIQPGPC